MPLGTFAALISLMVTASDVTAQGVNLAWNSCLPEGGGSSATYSCASNTGVNTFWVSAVPSRAHANFVGVDVYIDIHADADQLPDWWQVYNSGVCRAAALSVSFDFTTAPNDICLNPWDGVPSGGITAYQTSSTFITVPSGQPNDARLKAAAAMSTTSSIAAWQEYYCASFTIRNTLTTGTDACGGCNTPVCIAINQLSLADLDGTFELLTQPLQRSIITWQGTLSNCGTLAPQNTTWGQIETLYH